VVTREFLIPVLSEIYEGNMKDEKMFVPILTRLRNYGAPHVKNTDLKI
jgi:transposase